jgi:large subunit ribosomal protein L24
MAAKIRKGDLVLVIAGKDKGKTGKVTKVLPKNNRVIVEGVNIVKRHMRARSQTQPSGIIEMAAPIHISNVMLICPNCGEPTRVGFKITETGDKLRVCKKCGGVISDVKTA